MARVIGIGHQDFAELIASGCFYVDKTDFIREWWENQDVVTLIARPRRFGKTLNLSMLERFFSVEYKGQGQIFEGLSIWTREIYRDLQGTYPVIALRIHTAGGMECAAGIRTVRKKRYGEGLV